MKPVVRAFVAVEIAPSIRSETRKILKPAIQAFPNVKWVDDENFHITLKFLGSVPTTELHLVVRAIEAACRKFEQFDLVLEGVGAFPNAENPRTVWIGVADGVQEIRELARRIDAELAKLGYPAEKREFSPHLTVGRTRQKDRDQESVDGALCRMIYERANAFIGTSPVDAVVVYSSELERGGPKYEELAEIELSALGEGDVDDVSVPFDSVALDAELDDDPDWKRANDAKFEEHLPEKLDVGFDVDSLDDDVEEELRKICGGEFVERSNAKKGSAKSSSKDAASRSGSEKNNGVQPGKFRKTGIEKPRSSNRAPLPLPSDDDVPELDDVDLSEFDFFNGSKQTRSDRAANANKRRPRR